MSSRMKGARALGAVCLMLALAVPLISQTSTCRIVGTIADQTGAAVPSANVTVTDVQRGTTRTVVTDTSGEYLVPSLQPGVYKVRAGARGFKAVERVDIVVEVAQDLRVDLSLPTGLVSETVVVSEEVPLVNTVSSTLGARSVCRRTADPSLRSG